MSFSFYYVNISEIVNITSQHFIVSTFCSFYSTFLTCWTLFSLISILLNGGSTFVFLTNIFANVDPTIFILHYILHILKPIFFVLNQPFLFIIYNLANIQPTFLILVNTFHMLDPIFCFLINNLSNIDSTFSVFSKYFCKYWSRISYFHHVEPSIFLLNQHFCKCRFKKCICITCIFAHVDQTNLLVKISQHFF